MATFQELMRAAVNADKAGDADAAKQLVQMAQTLRPTESQAGVQNQPIPPRAWSEGDPVTPKVDRFGDTIADAVEGPVAMTKAYAAGVMDQENSPTMANMPEWMPNALRGPAALAGDAAMTGLGAAGSLYALGAGTVGEVFGGDPTQEKKLARDLMMMGEVAVPELSGVSGTVTAAGRTSRAARALDQTATERQQSARAADEIGVTPSLGAGGKVRGMTAATLEKVPLAGGLIADDAVRMVDEVEGAFNRAVAKVGTSRNPAEAGSSLQSGLTGFVTNFKEKSGNLFDAVGEKIPATTKIQTPATIDAINAALEPFQSNPQIAQQLGLNRWASMAEGLEGGLSWKAATDLRSSIGESIGRINGALSDMDQGKLKQAYATLTSDLEAAAIAAGPEAEAAWRRANNYYRRGAERISKQLDQTISAKSPERAFEAFVAMGKKDRASADGKRMFQIKASMPKEEWREVSASIIDRLGRSRPGAQSAEGDAFSPATFLTEWNKLSPEAKSVLVPQEIRQELNNVAKVSELAKEAGAERNFSNTGTIVAGAGVGAGLTSAPLTTLSLLGASWGSAKAMTSGPFLRALNRSMRGDTKAMKILARDGSPLKDDARAVLSLLSADVAGAGAAANSNINPEAAAIRSVQP